jgi:hypothetical protein
MASLPVSRLASRQPSDAQPAATMAQAQPHSRRATGPNGADAGDIATPPRLRTPTANEQPPPAVTRAVTTVSATPASADAAAPPLDLHLPPSAQMQRMQQQQSPEDCAIQ